jgi:hypothetical protein
LNPATRVVRDVRTKASFFWAKNSVIVAREVIGPSPFYSDSISAIISKFIMRVEQFPKKTIAQTAV